MITNRSNSLLKMDRMIRTAKVRLQEISSEIEFLVKHGYSESSLDVRFQVRQENYWNAVKTENEKERSRLYGAQF